MPNEKNSKIETAAIIAKALEDYKALLLINEKLETTKIDEVKEIHYQKEQCEYFDIRVPASVRKVIADKMKELFAEAAAELKEVIEGYLS